MSVLKTHHFALLRAAAGERVVVSRLVGRISYALERIGFEDAEEASLRIVNILAHKNVYYFEYRPPGVCRTDLVAV